MYYVITVQRNKCVTKNLSLISASRNRDFKSGSEGLAAISYPHVTKCYVQQARTIQDS